MTAANDHQVGGDHYKKIEYQHWDFVTDIGAPYVVANAMKYITRWRNKNGVQDLQKAKHYLDKAIELELLAMNSYTGQLLPRSRAGTLTLFCSQLEPNDAKVIELICASQYETAKKLIDFLIEDDQA